MGVLIPARQLKIKDVDNPNNWRWQGDDAYLVGDEVLDITGITGKTEHGYKYEANVVFKLDPNHTHIDQAYAGVGVEKLDQISLACDPLTPSKDYTGYYEAKLGSHLGNGTELTLRLTGAEASRNKFGLIVKGITVVGTIV